jgi:hypothetical protein
MLNPLKVATPLEADMVVVPDRVAPEVPVPEVMAMDTEALEEVTVFALASCRVMTGWVVKAVPPVAPEGWAVKTSLVAVPATILKALLVALLRPPEEAVKV